MSFLVALEGLTLAMLAERWVAGTLEGPRLNRTVLQLAN